MSQALRRRKERRLSRPPRPADRGLPEEFWPVLVDCIFGGDDYVLLLDQRWRILKANDVFQREIASSFQGLSFLEMVTKGSSHELEERHALGTLEGERIELVHPWQGGGKTVVYTFRLRRRKWIAVGRDQTNQLEIVRQLAVLVDSLETRVDSEKERATTLGLLAERDHLTGLANRRYLERAFDVFEELYRVEGVGFSVISVDIDHFKEVNDSFGHAAGDQALKIVAQILKDNIREEDCAARYGGEEFMVLVRGLELPASIEVAERLRKAVENKEMPAPLPRITISIGISSTMSSSSGEKCNLMELADEALYAAKKSGRNRVSVAE